MGSSKRRVPDEGRDPFVTEHIRRESAHRQAADQKRIETVKQRWQSSGGLSGAATRLRRQNTFLMYMFFILALVVYVGTQFASPKLVVQLDRGAGEVIIDGQERGRTGETIKNLKPGEHTVAVLPDSVRYIAIPPSQKVVVAWGLAPSILQFEILEATDPPDSVSFEPIKLSR